MRLFGSDRQMDRIERYLVAIAHKLDITEESIALIQRTEATMAATEADIEAKAATILAAAQAETNAVTALTAAWTANQAQLVQLKADLDTALAGNDPAAIQTASDNLDAGITAINANDVAIAALTNTPAAAPSGVAPTTAPAA